MVGYHNGEVLVETYNWTKWLEPVFRKLDGILSYQHFKMDSNHPGVVWCLKSLSDEPVRKSLLRMDNPMEYFATTKPEIVHPEGLSQQRKEYLYQHIREFCQIGAEDYVAPDPSIN